MTDTDALVAFVRARLDEDEAVAREVAAKTSVLASAEQRGWTTHYEDAQGSALSIYFDLDYHQGGACISAERLLAECETKRQIVDMYVGTLDAEQQIQDMPGSDETDAALAVVGGARAASEGAVRALAAVHATHPDYQQEWKP